MYQLTSNSNIILRLADNAYIPVDPVNADYGRYQLWVSQGNTPQPVPA